MTEAQIEQWVEQKLNELYLLFDSTNMTEYAYETRLEEINEWEWLQRNSLTLED